MADTTPITPDGKLVIPDAGHMNGLALALMALLSEAALLPDPSSITIYGVLDGHVHDEVSLQFDSVADSQQALALWAQAFGGVITAKTMQRDTGPELWVKVTFTYWDTLEVDAFAHIPLPETEASTEPDSEPEPAALT